MIGENYKHLITFTTWGLSGSLMVTYTLTLVRIIHRMTRFCTT